LCNSCASLAGLIFFVLSFIACFILLVIAPLPPSVGTAITRVCWFVGSFFTLAVIFISACIHALREVQLNTAAIHEGLHHNYPNRETIIDRNNRVNDWQQ